MTLRSEHKIIIKVIILSLLAISICALIIAPTIINIKKTANEIYELRAYMEKKYQNSLKSRLTKKKLEQIKQDSSDLPNHLFKVKNTLKLIQILETIADNNKVNQNINHSNLDKIQVENKVQIDLTISGQYLNVLNYLQNLETISYFANIENIRLIPNYNNQEQTSAQAIANLTIGLYVSK